MYMCIVYMYTYIYILYMYVCRLLDLLADRRDKSGKSGKILFNGQRRPSNYRTIVGYVVQVKCC